MVRTAQVYRQWSGRGIGSTIHHLVDARQTSDFSHPLFEEKRCPACAALIADFSHPVRINRPMLGAALATRDDPSNAVEFEMSDAPDQRL
jgi:hypothetical protein